MLNVIGNLAKIRFDARSMRVLWSEAVLFSILFGVVFRSWPVAVVLFMILFTFLQSQGRAVYAVFILSFLWGFIFAGLGFDAGGWIWALALGGFVFYKGVRIHFRDLKQEDIFSGSFKAAGWSQDWNFGRQNLN